MVDALQQQDVPYGNDWDNAAVVAAWTEAADQRRPWRARIRDHIAERNVRIELSLNGLVLYAAERPA